MADLLLAIDQGTTSSRAIVFDGGGAPLARAQQELHQIYPRDGWVEQDPDDIWRDTLAVCRGAIDEAAIDAGRLAAIGITNQRETAILWDRASGEPIYNAIVWQDRRTADRCADLVDEGNEALVQARTGLVIDPYFSATKIAWILDTVDGARAAAERGELAFGTVDSFLLWRLSGGKAHRTDATNAARTMLFDIHRQDWDDDLLALFRVPRALLPEVCDNSAEFGATAPGLLGAALPITGMAGDQQAAAVGQACFAPGMIKSTYGTGCFVLLNTGQTAIRSNNRLLTTIATRGGGTTAYALEGSIFNAGTAVQWLRDRLGIIADAAATDAMAASVADTGGVYMVPAFTGLGAPHWDPHARAAIVGLTRDSGAAHIVRAALEAACYQTRDLMAAMAADGGAAVTALRVDGGMAANDWMLQFLADILDQPVERPLVTETTALGAACLAGLHVGLFASTADIAARWRPDRRFVPAMAAADRRRRCEGWGAAVHRVLSN